MVMDVEALYRRYGDLVYGRCRTLLGNEADAAEATQEAFLRLLRYQDQFRGQASPSTYLFRMTTNHCLNVLRSKRRRPEDPVEELPPVSDGLLDVVELRDLLRRLLRDQDDRTRECVIYHFVDGLTHDEAGELMGISGAAVRKRIAAFRLNVAQNAPAWMGEEP